MALQNGVSDDSDGEFLALEVSPLIYYRRRRYRRSREMWVNHIFVKREEFGEFSHLWHDLQIDDAHYFSYFRMKKETFQYILDNIYSRLKKFSNFRVTISPQERLAITLRYLATGASFKTLAYSFRMSDVTVGRIVHETCAAVWESFSNVHMAFPSDEQVDEISREFWRKWKFPNCVGAIDGKHIRIKCPKHSGTMYYCYKKFFSIVLQGVVGPNYKFICIDVGAYGKQSDSGIFDLCNLNKQLNRGALRVHIEKQLPDSDLRAPHVIIGDEGYPLKPYLMRPYPDRTAGPDEHIFNKRLSLARQTVECAFGILSNKWRILLKAIEVTPDRAVVIVKCICLLHNIIIDREGIGSFQPQASDNASVTDNRGNRFTTLGNNRSALRACEVRETFKTYFVNNR